MKPSKYDAQRVLHVDGSATVHSGVIVGQSDDNARVYVKADGSNSAWDFTVKMELVPVLIKNAKLSS